MANNRNGRYDPKRYRQSGEIDRYNYVDRDIYSSSSRERHAAPSRGRSSPSRKRKKKKSSGRRILLVLGCLVLLFGIGVVVFGGVMLSRINYEDVDTTPYVQQPADAPEWDVISDEDVMNILLIGTDRVQDGLQRSDTMMLASIDNKHKKLKLTSFLRDMYLEVPTVGKTKLNASFSNGGPALTMQTIENNFRINIDRYVMIDVDSFADIIDKMGGIEVEVSQAEADEMNRVMGCQLSAGTNHMRGTLALYFSRMRAIDSDFGRTGRQRQVIGCMIDKVKTLNPAEATALMYDSLEYVQTNLTEAEIVSLIGQAFTIMDYPMETMHVPNSGTFSDMVLDDGSQVLSIDLEANCTMIRDFLYNDIPPA